MDQKQQSYFFQLEKHLRDLSPTDRAKAILQVENEVSEKVGPNTNIFRALGSPEQKAREVRAHLGLKPPSAPPRPKWPWIIAAFLMCFLVGPILFFYYYIVPIFDSENFDGFQSSFVQVQGELLQFQKSISIPRPIDFEVRGRSGKIEIVWREALRIKYECKLIGAMNDQFFFQKGDNWSLEFPEELENFDCRVEIPTGSRQQLEMQSGSVDIVTPIGHSKINLKEGNILLRPSSGIEYDVSFAVEDGPIVGQDNLLSTSDSSEHQLEFQLGTGEIRIDPAQ